MIGLLKNTFRPFRTIGGIILVSFILFAALNLQSASDPEIYEGNRLGGEEIEVYGEVNEYDEFFEISGYIKSLDNSKTSYDLTFYLDISILSAENINELLVSRTIDDTTDECVLGDTSEEQTWFCETSIDITVDDFDDKHTKSDFSIRILKNQAFKIILNSLSFSTINGYTKSDGCIFCCGGDVANFESGTFEINKTIVSGTDE